MPDLSTTWSSRLFVRVAGSVGAAAVIAGVVPALANAAGANLPNPVAVALRASGDVLTGGEEQDCVETKPGAQVTLPNGGKPASTTTCSDEAEESPSPSPSASASALPSASPSEEAEEPESEDANHGKIVSTVAHCAPKGKDPLLEVEGAPANHGGYVRPAAHGDSLATPWGTFDLSTLSGAEQLCAAVEAARAELAPEAAKEKGKKNKAKKPKKPHGGS